MVNHFFSERMTIYYQKQQGKQDISVGIGGGLMD
jgi:hypothetical protein